MFRMSPELETLVNFILTTKYEDLPAEVAEETRYLIMDTIGIAIGGLTTDPGKMAVALAKRLGGPPEASIIGVSGKISCSNAVLANGQTINSLDYDAMAGGHTPSYVVPPALAMAEMTNASGKDLILACALGFEIASRMGGATSPARPSGPGTPVSQMPPRAGYASYNFGAAAGAAKIMKLEHDKLAHALSIAGHLCQVITWMRQGSVEPRPMTKYGMAGWQGTGAIQAVLLAEMGYQGDTTLFDAQEGGFAKFCGYSEWHPEKLTNELGTKWSYVGRRFKKYACCSVLFNCIDLFYSILEKNNLKAEDIDSVKAYGNYEFSRPLFTSRELNNNVDIQFGLHNVLALIANGVKTGPDWQDMNRVRDPKIVEFANKVQVLVHPEIEKRPTVFQVDVVAKGKQYSEFRERSIMANLAVTYPQIIEKYKNCTARILTDDKINRSIEVFNNLEKLDHVQKLMDLITN
jgi:2-methylcitrate dehydratase PrpD